MDRALAPATEANVLILALLQRVHRCTSADNSLCWCVKSLLYLRLQHCIFSGGANAAFCLQNIMGWYGYVLEVDVNTSARQTGRNFLAAIRGDTNTDTRYADRLLAAIVPTITAHSNEFKSYLMTETTNCFMQFLEQKHVFVFKIVSLHHRLLLPKQDAAYSLFARPYPSKTT
jgi:hypothetical protein